MEKFAWITDSTCGLPQQFLEEHDIHVLPLSVTVDGETYLDDIELTKEQFYDKLKEHGEGAMTSQPSYGACLELYENLKGKYTRGIAIHASKALTGTCESSESAAKQAGFPVEVIDSKVGSYALGKMIRNGVQFAEAGSTYEEIVAILKEYTGKTEMYLLPSSLHQLKQSGRVSTTQAMFASLLHIHLLLGFDDGKVIVEEKIRTKKKAEKRLFQKIANAVEKYQLKEICVMHAGTKERAVQWKEEIEKLHQQLKVQIETLVPVAGVHTGFGTMAVSWLDDR